MAVVNSLQEDDDARQKSPEFFFFLAPPLSQCFWGQGGIGGVGLKQYDIIYNVGTGEENDKSDFWLLQNRVTNFENEISKKDTIIDYLTSQLFASKIISYSDKKNLHRMTIMMTLMIKEHPVPGVVRKEIISKNWLLLETHHLMGLMNVECLFRNWSSSLPISKFLDIWFSSTGNVHLIIQVC